MLKFIIGRVLESLPTIFVLITVSFFLIRLAPGGPFSSEKAYTPEVLANINAKYQLDKPLYQQCLIYLGNLFRGDLGPSFKYKDQTVNSLIAAAFPVSLKLGIVSFTLAFILGISAGITAALKQNTYLDHLIMTLSMTGIILPSFVFAPLLVLIFSIHLKWLPAGGWNNGEVLNMILPVCSLSVAYIATIARITRASMIEVLNSDFIRTAKLKGLSSREIVFKHALLPALIPVISYLGPAFVGIITGSIVIENIFGLPGIGRLFINGALNRDYSLVLSLTLLVGLLTILFNAIVDILYALIDPKIRYS